MVRVDGETMVEWFAPGASLAHKLGNERYVPNQENRLSHLHHPEMVLPEQKYPTTIGSHLTDAVAPDWRDRNSAL